MTDQQFLEWIHYRLAKVYGEPYQTDYMQKLASIARALPPEQRTPLATTAQLREFITNGDAR
jgi:hypothetical protein